MPVVTMDNLWTRCGGGCRGLVRDLAPCETIQHHRNAQERTGTHRNTTVLPSVQVNIMAVIGHSKPEIVPWYYVNLYACPSTYIPIGGEKPRKPRTGCVYTTSLIYIITMRTHTPPVSALSKLGISKKCATFDTSMFFRSSVAGIYFFNGFSACLSINQAFTII